MEHLHVIARGRDGKLIGNGIRHTPESVAAEFSGTGYRDDPELRAVVKGRLERGYHVNAAESWVAVTRCFGGAGGEGCRETLLSVVVGGDVRLLKAARSGGTVA